MKLNLLPASKNALLSYLFLLFPSIGFAQLTHDWNKKWSFGIMMGAAISNYSFSSAYGSGLPARSIKDLSIGGIVKRRFNESSSIVGEVNLNMEGSKWEQPTTFQETADAAASITSINIPIYLEYRFFHKTNSKNALAINAGVNNQIIRSSRILKDHYRKVVDDIYYEGSDQHPMGTKNYGLSGLVGLSYYFAISNSEFKVSGNYFIGLTNLIKTDAYEVLGEESNNSGTSQNQIKTYSNSRLKQNMFMFNVAYIF